MLLCWGEREKTGFGKEGWRSFFSVGKCNKKGEMVFGREKVGQPPRLGHELAPRLG